jgi:hypothetical protein
LSRSILMTDACFGLLRIRFAILPYDLLVSVTPRSKLATGVNCYHCSREAFWGGGLRPESGPRLLKSFDGEDLTGEAGRSAAGSTKTLKDGSMTPECQDLVSSVRQI